MSIKRILTILFICSISLVLPADEISKDLLTSEEYQIGMMVKMIETAIQEPEKPESLEIIAMYGTDTRYYVMIRGWLTQKLAGVQSQNQASHNDDQNSELMQKEIFLTKAIRRIDLE